MARDHRCRHARANTGRLPNPHDLRSADPTTVSVIGTSAVREMRQQTVQHGPRRPPPVRVPVGAGSWWVRQIDGRRETRGRPHRDGPADQAGHSRDGRLMARGRSTRGKHRSRANGSRAPGGAVQVGRAIGNVGFERDFADGVESRPHPSRCSSIRVRTATRALSQRVDAFRARWARNGTTRWLGGAGSSSPIGNCHRCSRLRNR